MNMYMKNGPPMSVVIIPTGISPPGSIRVTLSAAESSTAPAKREAGRSTRFFEESHMRSRCGTISPTKPITPLTETHTAVIAEPSRRYISRVRDVFTPSDSAFLSPVAIISSRLDSSAEMIDAAVTTGARSAASLHDEDERLPIIQKTIAPTFSPDSIFKKLTPEDSTALTIIPAIIKFELSKDAPRCAAAVTAASVTTADTSAHTVMGRYIPKVIFRYIAKAAPNEAPFDMPRVYGSASGF